jgi:outer membrane lipoprotein-sorting protein
MLRNFLIFLLLISTSFSNAEIKDRIVQNLKDTENLDFKFEQNINGKIENGNCTIEYQKKIFCEYARSNNKILVSNGKSLVIKTRTSYYRYPLEKTVLNLILDKNFLINKIYDLEGRIVDNSLINFKILDGSNEINIFFDKQTYDLVGWQNTDIYQNFNITFLSSIRKNRVLSKNLFKIPIQN